MNYCEHGIHYRACSKCPKGPKRLLLTGISGSIGSHFLAHIMHHTDWEVVGIESFRHKGWMDRTVEITKDHPEWHKRIKIYTHDLAAPMSNLLKKRIGRIDYIINMASLSDVEASIQDPVPFVQNNVNLALYMLEYAREVKPEVFIQISTDEVYGASASKFGDLRKEWDPIIPSNPYAASKAAQEAIAVSYWRSYGVPLIITNTMNNFGELQQPSKYPVMIQKAVMRGEELTIHGKPGLIGSRSYIHSRNFADAILFLIRNCPPYQHTPNTADRPDRYNIAGDKQLDNLELAQLIAKLMGKELKYQLVDSHTARPGHDPHYGLDSTKLYSLGWKPPLTFEESLKNTLDWQQANPEWIDTE
jgi:dTDP-glucose 4,6-dehydratase